jgi:hypothetical protein
MSGPLRARVGRLQLRLVLARGEHVDDIVVDEEDDRIVAFAACAVR